MSNIVEASVARLCFLDSTSLWAELQDWEAYEAQGADVVAAAVSAYSLRWVLEHKHPLKSKGFKSTDFEKVIKAAEFVRNFKEEVSFGKISYPYRRKFENAVFDVQRKFFRHFLTDNLREIAVKQHARGMGTANVARYLLSPESAQVSVFHHIIYYNPEDESNIIEWITPRLAYLKAGAVAFPRKYQDLWDSEREKYVDEIRSVPLTNTAEQVKALSDLYTRLEDAFDSAETDKGKAMLAKSLVQTMSGIFTLTRDPSIKLPAPSDAAD